MRVEPLQFTEVTQVSYPPAYKGFLEFTSVFSFDLEWVFSSSCLTSEMDFFDKLL